MFRFAPARRVQLAIADCLYELTIAGSAILFRLIHDDADVMILRRRGWLASIPLSVGFAAMRAASNATTIRRMRAARGYFCATAVDRRRRGDPAGRTEAARARQFGEGEIVGYGMSGDAYHISVACRRWRRRRSRCAPAGGAGRSSHQIDYINAHETRRSLGDRNRARDQTCVRGSCAQLPPQSPTKSMTGHWLVAPRPEAGITVLLASRPIAPPMINLELAIRMATGLLLQLRGR